jgi:hypothetical protein
MSENESLDTTPLADQLRNWGETHDEPGLDPRLSVFAEFLADRLNPSLDPAGYVLALELAIHDLRTGLNNYTEEPLGDDLADFRGLDEGSCDELRRFGLQLAAEACPKPFADSVVKHLGTLGLTNNR